jgi:hypothetical protein
MKILSAAHAQTTNSNNYFVKRTNMLQLRTILSYSTEFHFHPILQKKKKKAFNVQVLNKGLQLEYQTWLCFFN